MPNPERCCAASHSASKTNSALKRPQQPRWVRQHHFDASRARIPTVTFVETLVPLMVVAPNCHALVPSEITTGLLPAAGSVVELPDGSLVQPPIMTEAEIAPMMIAFFIA